MVVPDRGDIFWFNMEPVLGHEQAGKRPVVIISPKVVHNKTGMALIVPITTKGRGGSNEVLIEDGKIGGMAIVTQARFVDWKTRIANKAGICPDHALREIQSHLLGVIVND